MRGDGQDLRAVAAVLEHRLQHPLEAPVQPAEEDRRRLALGARERARRVGAVVLSGGGGHSVLHSCGFHVGADVAVHPGFEQLDGREPGQTADRVVDLARGGASLVVRRRDRRRGSSAPRAAARRCPPAPRSGRPEARGDARHGRPPEPNLGLAVVEEEVPRLVEHDALEQIRQHGMPRDGREAPVAGERRSAR